MLKSRSGAGWVGNASLELPSPLFLAPLKTVSPTDNLHYKKSENLTLEPCLHYITRPLCVSVFPTHIISVLSKCLIYLLKINNK